MSLFTSLLLCLDIELPLATGPHLACAVVTAVPVAILRGALPSRTLVNGALFCGDDLLSQTLHALGALRRHRIHLAHRSLLRILLAGYHKGVF